MTTEGRTTRRREKARPAEDWFTWHEEIRGRITFGKLLAAITTAQHDGVPADAEVAVSAADIYMYWRREVQ